MAVPVPKGENFGRFKRTRRTLVLAVVFVFYLVLGGVAFRFLETYEKSFTVLVPNQQWSALQEHLLGTGNRSINASEAVWHELRGAALSTCQAHTTADTETLLAGFVVEDKGTFEELLQVCGEDAYTVVQQVREVQWSFIDSVYFCMTVVTTIGYGHISPSSPAGQIFCIFYSLLGIPTSGLLLAGLSDFFAGNLLNFYDSKWQRKYGDSRWSLAAFTALYLLMGFLLFVFVPAIVFSWLEDWNYREAVYYAFITLSTIGFGDYTAAIAKDDAWTTVYKVFVMVWILVGLGYWVLVLNFLQKTLKSKEVVKTLRNTTKLIAKEADDLRQVLSDVGLIQRDAVFIPERSKMALSLMMNMSNMIAGSPQQAEGGASGDAPTAGVRGIHNIGSNLRSNSLLAALMASLPPPGAAPSPPSADAGAGAAQAVGEAGADNAAYQSDSSPSSPAGEPQNSAHADQRV